METSTSSYKHTTEVHSCCKKKKAALSASNDSEKGLQVLFLTLPRISSSAVGRSPKISADHLQNQDSNIFLSQQDVFRKVLGRHSNNAMMGAMKVSVQNKDNTCSTSLMEKR